MRVLEFCLKFVSFFSLGTGIISIFGGFCNLVLNFVFFLVLLSRILESLAFG